MLLPLFSVHLIGTNQQTTIVMKIRGNIAIPFLIIYTLFSCTHTDTNKKEVAKKPEIKYVEKELDSNWIYHVLVPENYAIHKSGAIDFFSYALDAPDSAANNFGKAAIFFSKNLGGPIYPRSTVKLLKDTLIAGKLLNYPVSWRVFQYEGMITGEIVFDPNGAKDIGAIISAANFSNLDSLMRIVSSLRKTQ